MRFLLLFITLPLLTGATWLAWQHRFQVDPTHPTVDLADLVAATPLAAGASWERVAPGQTLLVLKAGTPAHPVVQRLPLPGLPPAEFLLFDFKAQAYGLTPGPMPWADGRLMIEWHPEGRPMEPEYLGSARENYPTEISCLVASSDLGPALPVLRLEHLGISGSFLLERCRITVVTETGWWRYGRWLLLAGWFAWAAGVASGPTSGLGRPLLAGAIWLLCATQWAVPGPWQALRPMASSFVGTPAPTAPSPVVQAVRDTLPADIAPPPASPAPVEKPAPPEKPASDEKPASAESVGELEFHGSLLLEIKDKIKQARPLFHVLLFFFPTFVFAMLAGRWRSVFLASALAAGIEGAQYLFGYGFDRTDVLDLLQDAAGIGLALLAHHQVTHWLRKRRQGRGAPALPAAASPGQPT